MIIYEAARKFTCLCFKGARREDTFVSWISLPFGCLKFNVDEGSSGKSGLAGIEVLLHD